MKLRSVTEIASGKKVIMRMDLDVPIEVNQVIDNSRLTKSLNTLRLLLDRKNAHVVIVGHRGRPASAEAMIGKPDNYDPDMSLRPVYLELMNLLEAEGDLYESVFVEDIKDVERLKKAIASNHVIMVENLRFWKGEEENDDKFFEGLVNLTDAYVNDAITVAHREHASVMLYKNMETYYGLNFIDEVEGLDKAINEPKKPMTVILGGAKEDKLKYIDDLLKIADHVLIGGKLPKLIISNDQFLMSNEKVKIANLRDDGLDLSDEDIAKFSEIISSSKMIVWAGAMGFYEKENCRNGTQKIATAVALSPAYKIIAGGDTSASVKELGLKDKIDFVCSGGGVMLEMLVNHDLPAWN
jgi:phosphoglycerate kinase